jgi:tetratricopeptide (TPR) repeat protein
MNYSIEKVEVFATKVEQLYYIDSEKLQYEEIIYLSEHILPFHEYYSDVVLARLYLLLANVANNKGDVDKTLKFSQLGLKVSKQDQKIKLALLLNLASAYLAKKQFNELLETAEKMVIYSKVVKLNRYYLLSMGYRSVAFAILGNYERALADLIEVEQGINTSNVTVEYIELLTILATAYYHFGDYQTALTIQLKTLKLRFDLDKKENIDQTYLYIGYAYLYLLRFDDAYNAFWEAKKYAKQKRALISEGYARKGLGISLFKQEQFYEAEKELVLASAIFKENKLIKEYVETLVTLASTNMKNGNELAAFDSLNMAKSFLKEENLSLEYVGYYRMMADMYFSQGDFLEAYHFAKKHSQLLLTKFNKKKKEVKYTHSFYNQTLAELANNNSSVKTRELAVKLAESSGIATSYQAKYYKQRNIIIILFSLIVLVLFILLFYFLRGRVNKANIVYEESENKHNITMDYTKTKQHYQEIYQKSRKFNYPLSVCSITVENWPELTFSFNDKVVGEVKSTIINVIQEQLTEFEYAGMLNEGVYLLLFEHQEKHKVNGKIKKLVQTLNALFFGDLGEFSVIISHQLSSPDFKDIDPFSFLAKLNCNVKINTEN